MSSSEVTTVEFLSTTEESRPEVIIKNPQKMLEDVFNDVETNIEVDSNRLDVADAKKELDFMFGDQPVADDAEDKKTLLKLPEKKEVFAKKAKNAKKESKNLPLDDEPMMGDAPAEEAAHDDQTTTVATKPEASTTDRQRRDALETTLAADANDSTEATPQQSEESVTKIASTVPTEAATTEAPVVTTVTDEPTTKNIVQGHPLFHNHAIFKEPISVDNNNGSLERKDVSNTDDHFIPPMLLVKARFTATKSTEGIEETKEMTTDAITETTLEGQTVTEISDDDKNVTSKPLESNDITNEISSVTQVEVTPSLTQVASSERPILIEKRNDPRLGLNVAATTTTTSTAQPATSAAIQLSTTDAQSPSTTDEPTMFTEEASSASVSYESSVSEISTTESQTETTEMSESSSSESPSTKLSSDISTTVQPESTGERLIESTTQKAEASSTSAVPTPIAIKLTTLRVPDVTSAEPINKSTPQMGNDIDEIHESSQLHRTFEADEGSYVETQHVENNLNNEENFQPYKPNRHRDVSHHQNPHHGPGFSIGKILG
jgi:hypothetical protein